VRPGRRLKPSNTADLARYGTLRNWALELGKADVAELLAQTLAGEEQTDAWLTQLADAKVNKVGKGKAA
jgi:ferritin-like metal-binding protein YciE